MEVFIYKAATSKLETLYSPSSGFSTNMNMSSKWITPPVDLDFLNNISATSEEAGIGFTKALNMICGMGYTFLSTDERMGRFREWVKHPDGEINGNFLGFIKDYILNKITFGNTGIQIYKWGSKPEDSIFRSPRFNEVRIEPFKSKDGRIFKGRSAKFHLVENERSTIEMQKFDLNQKGLQYYHTHTPLTINNWMGVPRFYPSIPSMAISSVINTYTFSYFNNSASPDLLVTVTGKKLSPANRAALEKKIGQNSGAENAHQSVIFDVPDSDSKVTVTKIDNEFKECYSKQKKSSTEYAILAIGLSLQTVGFSGSGGLSSGTEGIAAFKKDLELTGMPYQVEFEEELNSFFEALWGFNPKMILRGVTISNDKDIAVVLSLLHKMNALSTNEVREFIKDGGILGNFPYFNKDNFSNKEMMEINNNDEIDPEVNDTGTIKGVKEHNDHHNFDKIDSEKAE